MLVEATETTITYRLKSGQVVVLQPGRPMELSDQAGQQLLRKAGDKVRLLAAVTSQPVVLRAVKPLTLKLDGRTITMDQWAAFSADADQAGRLLAQFPTQLEVLTLPAEPPAEPLQPGWLVTYRDRGGRLAGGCDDRANGTVAGCEWVGSGWLIRLTSGETLPLHMILSVGKTDAAGKIVAAWTVREHGYDGEGPIDARESL